MLLGSILASTILAWGLAAWFSYRDMKEEINQLFDAHLAESAHSLLLQARRGHHEHRRDKDGEHDDDDDDDEDERPQFPAIRHRGQLFERRLAFQLWDKDSQLLTRSRRDLPQTPLVPLTTVGFAEVAWNGHATRVYSVWNRSGTLQVQIAETMQSRLDIVQAMLRNALKPILLMIVPLLLAITFAVEYGLRILRRLSRELVRRTPEDLSPLEQEGVPREIQPITRALNALFERLKRALDHERRFTADAAHELRTPLAAIKVQAQVALRSQEEESRQRALEGVVKGIDRATHLVEQLLTMARLDPESELEADSVRLRTLLVDVVSSLAPEAVARNIDLSVKEGPDGAVRGQKAMLEILIRNLVDNAIRYTPASGMVIAYVEVRPGQTELIVEDNGPGLTEEQKEHVLRRFSRISRPSGDGSGLGLSIVERIARLHKAGLVMESGSHDRGLRVRVIFQNMMDAAADL
jgi:two-component system sensor histidine kinase QseC